MSFSFQILSGTPDSRARRGTISLSNSRQVQTPCFMPVGTVGALQGVDTDFLAELGYGILLANTFHLLQRPGLEVLRTFEGLHNFMQWKGGLLTDSGGFQIFSLAAKLKMSEEGASFRSYLDGTPHLLSPEKSIEIQEQYIRSDIMMVLDECVPSVCTYEIAQAAVERTTRWAHRSFAARKNPQRAALFGIMQGACFPDLRKRSAEEITQIPFDGFALGGLAVGEERQKREEITAYAAELLPRDKPRYLMGVGTPLDLIEAVNCGVDMFDCILPAALSRQGVAFTSKGKVHLRRGIYKFSKEPLDATCRCSTCRRYSRAYVSHLIHSHEVYGEELIAVHNLSFYARLMANIREAIEQGVFAELYRALRPVIGGIDIENPSNPPYRRLAKRLARGDFEIQEDTFEGKKFGRIRQLSSGERMHPVGDPQHEARALYLEQSNFESLIELSAEKELVVWDVGLGAATNAMEFVQTYEKKAAAALVNAGTPGVALRGVKLISFETDLDPLRLALTEPGLFRHLRHQAPHRLLENNRWERRYGGDADSYFSWELLEGDFLDRMSAAPAPDIILYDPFSQKTTPQVWGSSTFRKLRACIGAKDCALYTYAQSTAVYAGLLAAGFWVGRGRGSAGKESTTVAFSTEKLARGCATLLPPQWLDRWHRSDTKFPLDLKPEEREPFEQHIVGHVQFLGESAR